MTTDTAQRPDKKPVRVFFFAFYEKHSSCINMEPNIPIIIGFKAQTE